MQNAHGLVTDLNTLLEREYDALLSGDLVMIEHLISQKESLLESIGVLPISEIGKVQDLRSQLHRNQRLADSALKGMRAAITRAKSIKDVSSRLRTYGKDGRDSLVAMRTGAGLSKRS